MRNTVVSIVVLSSLFFSITLHAGQALNVVAKGTGSTCDEAKTAINDIVTTGSAVYSAEQAQTKQFGSVPAATAYCQNVALAPLPYLVAPGVNVNAIRPDPLKFYDVSVNRTCSFERDGEGNITSYFAVWTGSGACAE
jgi:hypothetical protein